MRHEVGDLVLSIDGEWMVLPPEKCGRGHRIVGNCLVSTHVCSCQDRHLSWSCNSCDDVSRRRGSSAAGSAEQTQRTDVQRTDTDT
jgi:hypothetical protein